MARRGQTRTRRCATEGCREFTSTHYDTKRDYVDAVRRDKGRPPWRCLRHDRPEQVLSVHQTEVVGETTVALLGNYGTHTWEGTGSTWAHGPGFMAWAADFPVGTRLTITARIDLPEGYEPPAPEPTPPNYHADRVDLD